MTNALYYGDNLHVLREHIKNESVDLVYLDPPFNSNANYNVLFKAPDGHQSQAQIEAFEDTWHWNENAEHAFDEVMQSGNSNAADMLRAMRSFLGENDMMAYLAMMAVRLIELHRVLKKTGSLYLHCDPTASHYLKILLDAVFGPTVFRNEIIWRRTGSHNSSKRFGPIHDTILFFTKSEKYKWTRQVRNYTNSHVKAAFRQEGDKYFSDYTGNVLTGHGTRDGLSGRPWKGIDPTAKGRHWALPSVLLEGFEDETEDMNQTEKFDFLFNKGIINLNPENEWPTYKREILPADGQPLSDLWTYQPGTEGNLFGTTHGIDYDVRWMGTKDPERLGYPTQKPVTLLERIVIASSNEGDVVLDPFCGCGTTVHAAQKLSRQWIGIDVTHLAISLIEKRLKDAFPGVQFEVHGVPEDAEGAADLAKRDKYQFQWWAVSMVDAIPFSGKKKGADGGIDGLIFFKPDGKKTERAIVSVKGGDNVSVAMVRDLKGVLEREKAPIGIFLSLVEPTKPMIAEAASAGFYDTGFGKFPKLQIITVQDLFEGKRPQIPFGHSEGYKKAAKETKNDQAKLI